MTILAETDAWDELEAARISLEAKAARNRKPSREEADIRTTRARMTTGAQQGLPLMIGTRRLVDEGKHPSGHTEIPHVQVYAFKHGQFRAYCAKLSYGALPCLVIYETACKKADKADQQQLQRVAKRAAKLMLEAKNNPLVETDQWPPQ